MIQESKFSSIDGRGEALTHEKRTYEKERRNSGAEEIITVISRSGDILIELHDELRDVVHSLYRVDSVLLKQRSRYFNSLLGTGTFHEGEDVHSKHLALLSTYTTFKEVPTEELPRVKISDIGNISHVNNVGYLMDDFLRIMHNVPLKSSRIPIQNLANIAVVADRFDACRWVAKFMLETGGFFKRIKPQSTRGEEEPLRQRILIGFLLNNEEMVNICSAALVHVGSTKWQAAITGSQGDQPLWWHLPGGLEEELQFRRNCVLNSVNSLLQHCIQALTGSNPFCKLYYSNSPACDSFQLGEFIRFLKRQDLFWLHGSFIGTSSLAARVLKSKSENIQDLIDKLRQIPSYQIDRDHHHCGPRKLLANGLDSIQRRLSDKSLGICLKCWESQSLNYAWTTAKQLPLYNPMVVSEASFPAGGSHLPCTIVHQQARDMFTAVDLDWSSLPFINGGSRNSEKPHLSGNEK